MKQNRPFGFIYKTMLPDGRFYIGQHKIISHTTLDPSYFGSGVIIKDYIKSKGRDSLVREIIKFGYSREEMNELEGHYVTEDLLKNPLCINLDTGGKYIHSRYPLVNKRIGKTISQKRKTNPKLWKSITGKDNNKSINWKLISPEGEEFIFCGGLNNFCKSKGISANTIKKAVREGWIPKRGVCSGWQAFNLDAKIGTVRNTLNHGNTHSGKNNPWYKSKKETEE